MAVACQTEDSSTQAVSGVSGTTKSALETAATTSPLPFDNPFPDRLNPSNDGSRYEPCVAFTEDELARFEIDYEVIEDAAIVNGQGIRGCRWLMIDRFSLGQVVTNSTSLDVYRRGTSELDWKPDLDMAGRKVGVFGLNDHDGTCSTYVQSGAAGVVTNVLISSEPAARASLDSCEIAIDFTRAYIDKIPE